MKQLIWIGMLVGSTVGSMIPSLWGASMFAFSSLLLGAVGGILGIYAGYRLAEFE